MLHHCTASFGNRGCQSGSVSGALKYTVSTGGIDTEEAYPYVARVSTLLLTYNTHYGTSGSISNLEEMWKFLTGSCSSAVCKALNFQGLSLPLTEAAYCNIFEVQH